MAKMVDTKSIFRKEDTAPALVAIAHGSQDPDHATDIEALMDKVRKQRSGLEVVVRYLEYSRPPMSDKVHLTNSINVRPVAVPLLLSRGYHLWTDVQVAARECNLIAAKPLGPDGDLIEVMVKELSSIGARLDVPIILAAAGSRNELGRADVSTVSSMLQSRLGVQVTVAYLGSVGPHVNQVAAQLRNSDSDFSVCSYLLSRGKFHSSLYSLGSKWVTRPLGSSQSLATLILRRYDEALGRHLSEESNFDLHSKAS